MTDTTVAQKAEAEAKPSAKADGAQETSATSTQDALKAILEDFDEQPSSDRGQAKDTSGTEQEGQDSVLAELKALRRKVESLEQSDVTDRTQRIVNEIKGDELRDVDDLVVRGYLRERFEADPRLWSAFNSSKRSQVTAALRAELAERVVRVNSEATANDDAINSAVRGAKSAAPKPKETEEEQSKKVRDMSDAEFARYKSDLDPTAARRFY